MESLKTASDTLFILLGAHHGARHARRIRLPGTGHRAQEEPGQRAGEDPGRLLGLDDRLLLHRLCASPTARVSSSAPNHLVAQNGYELVRFFFLLTFAAAIPAIVSGGIAERAQFNPQLWPRPSCSSASSTRSSRASPGTTHFGIQDWIKATFGEEFHDFAGSVVVHAMGGWIGAGCRAAAGRAPPAATARTAVSRRIRRPTFPSWPWAHGSSPSAGSAST